MITVKLIHQPQQKAPQVAKTINIRVDCSCGGSDNLSNPAFPIQWTCAYCGSKYEINEVTDGDGTDTMKAAPPESFTEALADLLDKYGHGKEYSSEVLAAHLTSALDNVVKTLNQEVT
jgi:hypothetical protein